MERNDPLRRINKDGSYVSRNHVKGGDSGDKTNVQDMTNEGPWKIILLTSGVIIIIPEPFAEPFRG